MKKKGLIISTVVMVVVLIASLTTATYAWFTTSAAAKIDDLTLETKSSEGLSIASVSYNDAVKLASGEVSLDDQKWFSNGDQTYGSELQFDVTSLAMAAVTGNGIDDKMLVATKDGTNPVGEGSIVAGKPVKLMKGRRNVDYFTVDLAIKINRTSISAENSVDLIMKTFSITGTGPMSAATRIALIPIDPDGATATASAKVGTKEDYAEGRTYDDTSAIYFFPYYDYSYSNGVLTKAGSAVANLPAAQKGYKTIKSDGEDYTSAGAGTLAGTLYKGTAAAITTGITKWEAETGNDEVKIAGETSTLILGNYTASEQVIYYRLVIWFDGEDAEAINASNGTGLTISIEFDTKEHPSD